MQSALVRSQAGEPVRGRVAQLEEHSLDKREVAGSFPAATTKIFGVWRSLAARIVRDDEVAGSIPATPTRYLRVAQLAAHVLWEHGVGSSNLSAETTNRDVAQPGSAPAWGAGGRRFKSCHPDQFDGGHGAVAALSDVTRAVVGSIPTGLPTFNCPIGGTGRRSGLKHRSRKACRFETCIGHQQTIPSWRNLADALGSEPSAERHARSTRAEGTIQSTHRAVAQTAESKALIRPGSVVRIHFARPPARGLNSAGQSTWLLTRESRVRIPEPAPSSAPRRSFARSTRSLTGRSREASDSRL